MLRHLAWWVEEHARIRPLLERAVRRRVLIGSSQDTLAEVAAELTRRLKTAAAEYPASWFGGAVPPESDQHLFRGLVFRILERRIADELRRAYLRRRGTSEALDEQAAATRDPETLAAAREKLRRLAEKIEELPADDRELLYAVGDGAQHLLPRDRVRLHRLRRRLVGEVGMEGDD